jgi:hypothetical protein
MIIIRPPGKKAIAYQSKQEQYSKPSPRRRARRVSCRQVTVRRTAKEYDGVPYRLTPQMRKAPLGFVFVFVKEELKLYRSPTPPRSLVRR